MNHYEQCLANGCSATLAEMFVSRRAPGIKSSTVSLMSGRLNNQDLDRMPKHQAEYMVKKAKRAGQSVSGKVYVAGLAKRSGDPNAWVSDDSELLAKLKQRGLSAEGAVNYTAPEQPPKKTVKLNPRIVNEHVKRAIQAEPGKKHKLGELREQIIEKHGSPYAEQ